MYTWDWDQNHRVLDPNINATKTKTAESPIQASSTINKPKVRGPPRRFWSREAEGSPQALRPKPGRSRTGSLNASQCGGRWSDLLLDRVASRLLLDVVAARPVALLVGGSVGEGQLVHVGHQVLLGPQQRLCRGTAER